jgi:zinc protease
MLTLRKSAVVGTLCFAAACNPSTPAKIPATQANVSPPTVARPTAAPPVEREAAPASIATGSVPFPNVVSSSLKNGLALDVVERSSMPIVHLSLVVATGHARDENHPGVARVTAQLLESGGAGRWSSEKLREAVDGLGSSLDISSSRDTMRWSLAVTSDKLREALAILAALAENPRFDRAEFVKLKARELERVRSLAKTSGSWLAQYWLHRELYQQALGIHPYASIDVLPSELERLKLDDCKAFYRAQVVPSNARIIAIGAVNLPTLTSEAERSFGGWKGPPAGGRNYNDPIHPDHLRMVVVDRPASAQSDVQLGLLGPSRHSTDFAAITTIQQIVGGGVAGRLFLDVREKRSLAYSTYASIQEVALGPSVLTLSAGTQTAKTADTVAALLEHLDRLGSDPGTLQELETAQSYVIRGMPARWETVESLSSQVLLLRTQGQSDRHFDELRDQISNLSTPVLKEPAQRYYRRSNAVFVIAGDADKIVDSLRRFGPIEVLDPEREFSIKRRISAE